MEMPQNTSIFAAAPFRKAGGSFTTSAPKGWPFDIKWIQLLSVGLDSYPEWLFDGPIVTSARGTSAVALAEFVMASVFAAAKHMPEIWIDRAENWAPGPLGMIEGSTLGVFGFGASGRALSVIALAMGMRVLAVRKSNSPIDISGVEQVSDIGVLFEQSDHVVLAAPATRETQHIVNAALLRRAKSGLHLVNIARGILVDDNALLNALDEERIGLVTLDVTHPEPLPSGHPFYSHPKVRLSPHTSVFTSNTVGNLASDFVDNFTLFEAGRPLTNVVDLKRGY